MASVRIFVVRFRSFVGRLRLFWFVLGCSGSIWAAVHRFVCWVVLGRFGSFWVVLGHFGSFWGRFALSRFGSFRFELFPQNSDMEKF